jgi:hypothetical protein
MTKPDSLKRQIGGTHYSSMGMQPFEFSLRNGWDAAAHSILKYVARHQFKGGVEDLRKAYHICDIRAELFNTGFDAHHRTALYFGQPVMRVIDPDPFRRIAMDVFIDANKIDQVEAMSLDALETWVLGGALPDWTHKSHADRLKHTIRDIMHVRYERKS